MKNIETIISKIDSLVFEIEKYKPLTKDQEGRIFQKFRLDWNYHSNAIEGNSLNLGETRAFIMEGLTAKGKPLKDHLDIKGHNDAINFLLDIIKNEYFTEKDIRELHKLILVEPYISKAQTKEGIPTQKIIKLGQYKSSPNHVKTLSGEIHYYAMPEETPAKMADLMSWLKENSENYHPFILAALFHYKFVEIHPFDDGNGRMARLLMNFILMKNQFPPVVIKKENREAYYFALRNADAGNTEEFIVFIGENLIHSLEIYFKGAKGENIEEIGDFEKELLLYKKNLDSKNQFQFTWSDELQKEESDTFLNDFFIKLRNKLLKFSGLFLNLDYYLAIKSKKNEKDAPSNDNFKILGHSKPYKSDAVYLLRIDSDKLIPILGKEEAVYFKTRHNVFIFQFRGFKFKNIPFDFEMQFHILFNEYFIEIFLNLTSKINYDFDNHFFRDIHLTNTIESKELDKLILRKKYREDLDESEVSEIIENTGKFILESIKKEELKN